MASNEAFKKQAEGANDAAKKYMEENEKLQEVSELCMKMPVFMTLTASKEQKPLPGTRLMTIVGITGHVGGTVVQGTVMNMLH